MNRLKTLNGFSLLELLAVLAIMGAILVTVMPALLSTGGAELRTTARTLAAGLRRARSQAIQQHRTQSLTVDVNRREFELSFEGRTRKLPDGIDLKLFTARSAIESEGRGAIRFFADGGSTGGRITVSNPRSALLVDVDWLSGQVRILDAPPEQDRRAARPPANRQVIADRGHPSAAEVRL